ncbi:MAG: 23S rRNA methyltransferase [Coxiella sp. DG_40]|nr:MAG: 23S rRNA methyltransferase [Coxiella sp. DG_40]
MESQYIYGLHAVEGILRNAPQTVRHLFIQRGRYDQRIQKILQLAHKNNIQPEIISRRKLEVLLPECQHQGVAVIIASGMIYRETDLVGLLDKLEEAPFLLILDSIQDPHNLGACLRSANAAGIDAVIAPKDNAVGLTPVVRKVACGAAETTPFIQVTNLVRSMHMLKDRGIWLYGTTADAKTKIYDVNLTGPIGLVLGGEEKGIRRLTREHCDGLMSIPMLGTVSSLNVSVAAGICLFEAIRQRFYG